MTLTLMELIHVTNPGMYPRPPHQHPEFSGRMIVMFVAHVFSAAAPTADLAAVSIALVSQLDGTGIVVIGSELIERFSIPAEAEDHHESSCTSVLCIAVRRSAGKGAPSHVTGTTARFRAAIGA